MLNSYQHPDAACTVDRLMGDERLSGQTWM
jgi:hypothetical protein